MEDNSLYDFYGAEPAPKKLTKIKNGAGYCNVTPEKQILLGSFASAELCAYTCKQTTDCLHFSYNPVADGVGGECVMMKTTTKECLEGFLTSTQHEVLMDFPNSFRTYKNALAAGGCTDTAGWADSS
jgi:hypothetical protein